MLSSFKSKFTNEKKHYVKPIAALIRIYHELSFCAHGDPKEVVQYRERTQDSSNRAIDQTNLENANTSKVYVDMISAPWNPADHNVVEGKYPSPYGDSVIRSRSDQFPGCTVVGSEGWGRIIDVYPRPGNTSPVENNSPFSLKPGDFVSIGLPGLGTMRSSLWVPSNAVVPIKRGQELYEYCQQQRSPDGQYLISTLFQLGGTAIRMLRDFEALEDGDIVIQNAGNSGVGLMLSQLAVTALNKHIHPVSLIRRGQKTQQQFDEHTEHLSTIGKNSIIFAEEDLASSTDSMRNAQQILQKLSDRPPKLAINAVGGESASLLLKLIGPSRTMVTYGGMSMKPVTIGTSQLIFKDVRAVGYWHSRWMIEAARNCEVDLRMTMIDELIDLFLDGKLVQVPAKVFSLCDISKALDFAKSQSSVVTREKVVFNCTVGE